MQLGGQQHRDEVAVAAAMAARHPAAQLAEGLLVAVEVAKRPAEVAEPQLVVAELAVIGVGDEREHALQRRARLVGAAGGGVREREHHERGVFQPAISDAAGVRQGFGRDGRDAVESQVVVLDGRPASSAA